MTLVTCSPSNDFNLYRVYHHSNPFALSKWFIEFNLKKSMILFLFFSPLEVEDVRVIRLRDSLRSASIHFPLILSDSLGYLFLHHLLRKGLRIRASGVGYRAKDRRPQVWEREACGRRT